jgi:hypothetical protein
MILREFKVWGGKREENDSLYIWAKDADDAIEIARLTDQSICISQWTGNEKSYEEVIKLVKEVADMSLDLDDVHYEALQMAIKALEQEPCEDAISRQSMLDYMKYLHDEMPEEEFIKELPSVKPVACIATVKFSKEDMQELVNEKMKDIVVERKKGKWINKSHTSGCGIKFVASECTCCGKKTFFDCDQLVYNYCPNCGAEMDEDGRTLKYSDQDTMMQAT